MIHHLEQCFIRVLRGGLCFACGRAWHGKSEICDSCQVHLPRINNPCSLCGLTNRAIDEHPVCPGCLINPPRWQAMFTPYHYSGLVRRFLLQAKFANDLPPVKALCQAHTEFSRDGLPWPEVLLPVPLHQKRLQARGFNQASEFALFWSKRLGVPVDRHCLRRIKDTKSQSGLTARLRQQNIRGAFQCQNPGYRHVAIIDDIITTGSTLSEITRLLHQQGVEFVEVWALARACRKDQMG